MKLTALEIKQQTFDKSLRGYDPAEVKAFLNLVSNEWEHLVAKNKELESQIKQLNEKLKHYERVESALHETLQTARESAEQKLGGARQESKNIMDKAEMEAEAIIREAYQERQQIRQSIVRLLDKRNEMIAGIRSYLDRATDSLEAFSKDESDLFSVPPAPQESDPDPEKRTSGKRLSREDAADSHSSPNSSATEPVDEKPKKKESGKQQKDHQVSHKASAKEDSRSTGEDDSDMDDILDQID